MNNMRKMMKKSSKIVISIIAIIIICGIIAAIVYFLNKPRTRPNYNPIATITLSIWTTPMMNRAISYDIYSSSYKEKAPYFYIKSVSGSFGEIVEDEEDIASGDINNREDILFLKEEIEEIISDPSLDGSEVYCSFKPIGCNDIDDLTNKLFP